MDKKIQKEIEKKYNEMLLVVENRFGNIDLANRVNCYRCPDCGHITKTKDIDKGVTPMFIACKKCNCTNAASSFYNDIAPGLPPTFEWYRPSLEETLQAYAGLQQHVLNGGLNYRKIEES